MADPRKDTYSSVPFFIASANVAAGATGTDYDGRFFIAPFACEVLEVREVHQTLGTEGTAVTLMVKKCASGTAKASGTDVLASGLSLKTTIDTPQTGTLHATAANSQLAEGDSLALVLTGTATAVDGVTVQAVLRIR